MRERRASAGLAARVLDHLSSPNKESPSQQLRQVMAVAPSAAQYSSSSTPKKRRRGRSPGSKNKPKSSEDQTPPKPILEPVTPLKRPRGRPVGSKNKLKNGYLEEPPAKRLRLMNPHFPDIMRATFTSISVPGALTAGFPDQSDRETSPVKSATEVNESLAITALNMSTLFASGSASHVPTNYASTQTLAAPPQTPKKSRKTTKQTSLHFNPSGNPFAPRTPGKQTPAKSEHFSPKKRADESIITFPPLKAKTFGLIQEELASNPFHVLLATMFLAKTTGTAAIPVIRGIAERYPTPESLATAAPEDLFPDISHLGLGSRRAQAMVELAKAWAANSPEKGRRWKRVNYPAKGAGRDILPRDEPLDDDDPREAAFEIAHLPHIGPYGLDSWRIFCRDDLRDVDSKVSKKVVKGNEDAIETELAQEWTRVVPEDKELRAYIKWRWLRLGFDWNPETHEKKKVNMKVLKKMQKHKLQEHEGFSSPWKGN